jgi:uncharacterized protein YecT (DUF1311 family)
MHRGYRYLSSLLLTAALTVPVAMMAAASPEDNRDHERQGENNKRYYDKNHKDYHTWDRNEDRAYQRYQAEHHEKRAFAQLNSRQQSAYFSWRHNNPDNR